MSPLRLAERLLQLIPVLLGISVIVFAMMALTPGDPVQIMLGDSLADQAQPPAHRGAKAPQPLGARERASPQISGSRIVIVVPLPT